VKSEDPLSIAKREEKVGSWKKKKWLVCPLNCEKKGEPKKMGKEFHLNG